MNVLDSKDKLFGLLAYDKAMLSLVQSGPEKAVQELTSIQKQGSDYDDKISVLFVPIQRENGLVLKEQLNPKLSDAIQSSLECLSSAQDGRVVSVELSGSGGSPRR